MRRQPGRVAPPPKIQASWQILSGSVRATWRRTGGMPVQTHRHQPALHLSPPRDPRLYSWSPPEAAQARSRSARIHRRPGGRTTIWTSQTRPASRERGPRAGYGARPRVDQRQTLSAHPRGDPLTITHAPPLTRPGCGTPHALPHHWRNRSKRSESGGSAEPQARRKTGSVQDASWVFRSEPLGDGRRRGEVVVVTPSGAKAMVTNW